MPDILQKILSSLGSIGLWGIIAGTVFTALSKAIPEWRKGTHTNEDNIREDLIHRIDALETRIHQLEDENQRQREHHDSEMRVMRHKLNNETASLDALLMLMEAVPDKVGEHVERIKEMRKERAQNIAIESGNLSAKSLNNIS